MGKGVRVGVCVVALVFLSAQKVAFPQEPHPLQVPRTLQASDITIPADLGYVIETHQSATQNRPSRIIIHIQEAHTNYEAQKHIVSILERLIKEHGLKLVMVEGGEGDVSLSYLRHEGTPEKRQAVAEKYLKLGILSAEEYLDIVSDYPLILWGVEQQDLYDQNLDAFLTTESLQQEVRPLLSTVDKAVEALRPLLAHQGLNQLDTKVKAFEAHELSLSDYVDALAQIAAQDGKTLQQGSNLSRFIEVRRRERSISRELVQQEQRQLISRLSEVAPEKELDALITKALAMKQGALKPVEFYAPLERLAASSHVSLDAYPNLLAYIRYVSESAEIDATTLSHELDACVADLRRQLTASPEAQAFAEVTDELDLVHKLLELRLSPEEYLRLQAKDLASLPSHWDDVLNAQLKRHGLAAQTFPSQTLKTRLPNFKRFYEAAQQRDEALVRNAIQKLQESGESLAVLITGGFHSSTISRLLSEQGVATVVLTPKVSQPTNERLYRAVVKYKSDRGSFEEVVSIANESSSSPKSEVRSP